MPKVSTKHPKREKELSFTGFPGGYNQDQADTVIPVSQLSKCKNLKYAKSHDADGREIVSVKLRQGTTKLSNTALPSSAYPVAETYYKNQSKYVIAGSDSKLYYLDGSNDPALIGTLSSTSVRFTEFNQKLIIHDTGVTKYWDGTTFEALDCRYEDELIGTGDNAETEYTHTCSNLPPEASSLTIDFTDATAKTITDNGTGALTGNVDATWAKAITGCADNGAGLIRVTTVGHGYSTSDEISIADVVGTIEANNSVSNPTWTITKIDNDNYDLQGSTFAVAYTSGGVGHKNTVIYSTGALKFKCDGAPDASTTITCDYDDDGGAPTSKDGLVRAARLYTWGDSTNTSRLSYTAPNDQETLGSSSASGGTLDCDPNDGYTLVGVLNFFQSLLLIKDKSLHRLDNFPGDTTFRVEPLIDELGSKAYRTALNEGNIISFLSSDAWEAMESTQRYGDIQKTIPLSNRFSKELKTYADANAAADYNQIDKQLWLNLYDSDNSEYLDYIHVINLDTGGQLSLYEFAFTHTCFKYVNGEMLIGGSDGHLYKLDDDDSTFRDNAVSYSDDTIFRTAFTDFNESFYDKLLKQLNISMSSKLGFTGTLNIYTNKEYDPKYSISLSIPVGDAIIGDDGDDVDIVDMGDMIIGDIGGWSFEPRLVWDTIMFELTDIYGAQGAEIFTISTQNAFLGS